MANKESWGSRVGLILAMAGSAVGMGNFLRFPVQAIQNGGGAFIIPYLVCFLLMGVPLLYVEWAMGRYGGRQGYHSTPFILDSMDKRWFWKYIGVFGIFTNIAVAAYYCYLESWTLSYVWHSIAGSFQSRTQAEVAGIFDNYVSLNSLEPIFFWILCILVNAWVLSKGLSGGIEKVAKIGMPLLILFGVFLAIKAVSIKAGHENAIFDGTVGLNYLWTPEFSSIWSTKVWLAAAGQIFFTLSVGMGSIHCYASYVRSGDDIALNSQSAGWMNEFVEVVLGGCILIPIAIGYFGIDKVVEMAGTGGLGMGFKTMPYLFQQWGPVLAAIAGIAWFSLLFFAGITSSLAMGTPLMGFLEDEFNWTRERSAWTFGVIILVLGLPTVLYYNQGVFDEFDYWAGTVALVIFALAEIILFAWVLGMDKGWREIMDGADIHVPVFFKFIIKWVTPLILAIVFLFSLPDIWKTIDHAPTKYEIACARNPQILRTEIHELRESRLQGLSDSIIFKGNNIMNSQNLEKSQKEAIFTIRTKETLYKKYIAPSFQVDKFIAERERMMQLKNISRPFLLLVFGLTAWMVFAAVQRRKRAIKYNLNAY